MGLVKSLFGLKVCFLGAFLFYAFPVMAMSDQELNVLKGNVEARWSAIEQKKFENAYEFQTPKYRAVFEKSLYIQQFNDVVQWRLTKTEDIKYDAASKVATVRVEVETKNTAVIPREDRLATVQLTEKWLLLDGKWWYVVAN